MNNKYYTPTIEEFHVGFEYEMNYKDNEWSYEFTPYDFDLISDFIREGKCRVKYLDLEDIKSLGFEYKWEERGTWSLVKDECLVTFNPGYTKGNVKISYLNRKGFIFKGQIKNKSEFRRLLKQLGI